MDQIAQAAKMAGEWWAERLSDAHQGKRTEFAAAVAKHCETEMRARAKSGGKPLCWLEVDYDPQGPMLDAVREVIDPDCKGMMFSARGILPQKHELKVEPRRLEPKEGYGNWTAPIEVPNERCSGGG